MVLDSKGMLLALPVNIRPGLKMLAVTNALAYNTAVYITTLEASVQALGLIFKS
jgi:hypothetical protein